MNRESILYKIRRKGQVIAHRVLPNEILSKIYFKIVLGKKLNLINPRTFNEKIQWLKLYYLPQNKNVIACTDKYSVRDYLKNKGYGKFLTPLLGNWDKSEDINWDTLPKSFVLKCTHGCAYNIIVQDKYLANEKVIKKQLNTWLREDFGAFNIEIHYSKIEHRRIICEEFLGNDIIDYKFFCFNGEPRYMYISKDLIHDRQAQIGFFYLDGTKMPMKRDDYKDLTAAILPSFFSEMVNIAKDLSKEFPFVRVDFFVTNNRFYFAELTFTPGGGMMPFNPEKYDLEWGSMLNITGIMADEYKKKEVDE